MLDCKQQLEAVVFFIVIDASTWKFIYYSWNGGRAEAVCAGEKRVYNIADNHSMPTYQFSKYRHSDIPRGKNTLYCTVVPTEFPFKEFPIQRSRNV